VLPDLKAPNFLRRVNAVLLHQEGSLLDEGVFGAAHIGKEMVPLGKAQDKQEGIQGAAAN